MGRSDGILSIPGFTVRQSISPQVPLTMSVQQAVALMMGYAYGEAIVLRSSPSGVLYVAEPRVVDVFQWTATGADEAHQGSDIRCTEIMVMGHPDNTDNVYVRPRAVATSANSIPIAKNIQWTFSVENLNELHATIHASGDTLIVAYSL